MSPYSVGAPGPRPFLRGAAPEISIVVPVFNEEATLHELYDAVAAALDGESWEIVLVNDGSRDRSREILHELAAEHSEVVAVELARNFGQHPAVLAGFSIARGRYIGDVTSSRSMRICRTRRARSRASSPS